jgi:hypothetical protein
VVDAPCESCGKIWKIPEAGKTYRCKACGGLVKAAEKTAGSPCPACGAIQAGAGRFCEECGASLDPGAAGHAMDASDRATFMRELRRTRDTLKALRAAFVCGAIFTTLPTVLMLIIAARAGENAVLFTPGAMQQAIYWIVTAACLSVYVTGAVRIFREPLLWSVVIAGFETLRVALVALLNSSIHIVVIIIWTLWVLALWILLLRVIQSQRFIVEHPDEWSAQGLGRRARASPRSRRERRDRRGSLRLAAIGGGAVAVAAIVILIAIRGNAPPALDDALQRFQSAWNENRVPDLAACFIEERRAQVETWLRRKTPERDWSTRLPSLQNTRVVRASDDRNTVHFETRDARIVTHWRLVDGTWQVSSIGLD